MSRAGLALLGAVVAFAACREEAPPAQPPARVEAGEDAAVQRGRQIYTRGTSASGGPIFARVSREGPPVPADVLPCGGCHGVDGRGRPEGGVAPSNIRWESLTRPYEATEASGRHRPPYSERLFRRAVSLGIDPAGQPLHDAMPRYEMSRADADDLLAYLRTLSQQTDPGLSADEVRIGLMVPDEPGAAEDGRASRAVVEAYFSEINRRGGIYGRRLSLRFAALPSAPGERRAAVQRFLDTERPFALLGAVLGGADDGVPALLDERKVPLVGALSAYPPPDAPGRRYTFYLYSGVAEQAQVLLELAAREKGRDARIAIVRPGNEDARRIGERLVRTARERGWGGVAEHVLTAGRGADLARELARRGTDAILFLGPRGEDQALWAPLMLVPGSLSGQGGLPAPPGSASRLLVAFPTSPAERAPQTLEAYQRLAEAYRLPEERLPAQLSALAGALVLVEGVVRSGHDLWRERMVDALEGLRGFRTGLVPDLTFGRDRRVGSRGAYVFELGRGGSVKPLGGWVEAQ